ncbi:hypothetical protein C4J84_4079 [Pseudomonas sp. R11-23-07]|nr:hypothetical protein C4J84_4079 [Pseudomonas sp. R11-23-07]
MAFFVRACFTSLPCRSELAREKLQHTAGYLKRCVILDAFREQARSYNESGKALILNKSPLI